MSETSANVRANAESANLLKEQLTRIKLLTNDNHIKDQQIEILKDNIRELQDRIANSERGARGLEEIIDKRESELRELGKTIEEMERHRLNNAQKLDVLTGKLNKGKLEKKALQDFLDNTMKEKEASEIEIEGLKEKIRHLDENLHKAADRLKSREAVNLGIKDEKEKQEQRIAELQKTINSQKADLERLLKENLRKENKLKKLDVKVKGLNDTKESLEREKSAMQVLKIELDQIRKKNIELNEKLNKNCKNNEKEISSLREIESRILKADHLNDQLQADVREKDRDLLIKTDEIAECYRARKEEKFFTELDFHNLINYLENYTKDSGVCPFRSEHGQQFLRIRSLWERMNLRKEDDDKENENLKKKLRDLEKEIILLKTHAASADAGLTLAEYEAKNNNHFFEDKKAENLLELEHLFSKKEKKMMAQIKAQKDEIEQLRNRMRNHENIVKEKEMEAISLMETLKKEKDASDHSKRELFEKELANHSSKSGQNATQIKNLLIYVFELLFFLWRRFQLVIQSRQPLKKAALARLFFHEELKGILQKKVWTIREIALKKFKKSAHAVLFCKRLVRFSPKEKLKCGRLLYGDPLANTLRWASNKMILLNNNENKGKISRVVDNLIVAGNWEREKELLLKVTALFNELEPTEDKLFSGLFYEWSHSENDADLLGSIEALGRENKYLSEEFAKVNERLLSFDHSYTEIQNENLKLLNADRNLKNKIAQLENELRKCSAPSNAGFNRSEKELVQRKMVYQKNNFKSANNSRNFTNSDEKENQRNVEENLKNTEGDLISEGSTVDFLQREIASKQKKIRDLEDMFESSLKRSCDFAAAGPPSFENSQQFIQKIPGRIYSSGTK